MAHNASPQTGVVINNDPALNVANEHTHEHLHHGGAAAKHHDNVVFTSGTTDEPSIIPNADRQDDDLHKRKLAGDNSLGSGDVERGYANEKSGIVYGEQHTAASSPHRGEYESADPKRHVISNFYKKYRIFFHAFFAFVITGWWIVSLALHRNDMNWIIPFLFWLAIMLRLITFWVPVSIVTKPMHFVWKNTGTRFAELIPAKLRTPLAAALVIGVIIIGTFASEETASNTRADRGVSLGGMAVFLFLFWGSSKNRSKIVWQTVIVGFLMQFIVALFVLRTGAGYSIFRFISDRAVNLLSSAGAGTAFLTTQDVVDNVHWFLIAVIPPIIFFIAVIQVLCYWGFVQWFVGKFAVFFFWALKVSGAEAVVASATPFIGQGESAMLIKPFIAHLTMAEIHQVMTSGFATIAGSVLVAYIGLGVNPEALISSCVMSIPASLAMSKIRYPETEETLTAGRVVVPDDDEHRAANVLHAFANGAWLGIKIAGMIVATQLCIIALVFLINLFLTWWGRYLDLNGEYDLTIQLVLGYVLYPVARLIGVPRHGKDGGNDILRVSRLIATKIIQNEFVAFLDLTGSPVYAQLADRSRLIATYALCGFGNVGSLGTQIGVLSQVSPGRGGDVSRVAVSALITGIVSTLTSASMAGLVITDQKQADALTSKTSSSGGNSTTTA